MSTKRTKKVCVLFVHPTFVSILSHWKIKIGSFTVNVVLWLYKLWLNFQFSFMSWRNSIVIHLPCALYCLSILVSCLYQLSEKEKLGHFLISILGFWLENWNCNCGFKCSNGTISYVHPMMFVFCNCALLHVLYSPAEGSADFRQCMKWAWVRMSGSNHVSPILLWLAPSHHVLFSCFCELVIFLLCLVLCIQTSQPSLIHH